MSDIDEEKNQHHAGYNYMTILRLKKIEDPEVIINYVEILPLLAAKDTPLPKTKATLALLRSWTDLYTTVINNINEFVKTSFSDDGIIPSKEDIIENIITPLDPTGINGYTHILSSILDDIYKESISIYAKPTIQKRVEEIAKEALPEEEKVQYKVQDEPDLPENDELIQHVINRIRIVRRYLQTHPYAFVPSEYIKKIKSMVQPKMTTPEEFNIYVYTLLSPFKNNPFNNIALIKEELKNLNVKEDNDIYDKRIYSILEKENHQFNKEIQSFYTTLLLAENDILVKLALLNDVFIRKSNEEDDEQESILDYVERVKNELPEISPIVDSYLLLLQYIGELKNTFIVKKDQLEGNGSGISVAERAIAKLNEGLEEFMALSPEERQKRLDANEKRKKNREQKKKRERKEEIQEKIYTMYVRSQINKVLENVRYNTHEEYKQLLELAHQDVEDEIDALSQEELDQVLEEFRRGLKPGELPSVGEGKPEEVAKVKSEAEKERLYRKQQLLEQKGLALPRDQVNLPYYALLAYYDNNPLIVVEDPSLTMLYSNFPNINTQFKNEFLSLSPQDRLRFIRRLDKYSNMEEKTQSFKTFNQVYNTGQSLQFYVFDFLHSFVIENKPGNGCDVLKANLEDELVDIQSNLSRWVEVYGENVKDRLMLYLANKYKCEESDVRNTYVVKRKNKRREEKKEEEKKEEEKDEFSWKSIYVRIGEIVNEGLEGQLEILEKLTTEYPSLVSIDIFKDLIAKLMELVQQKEERVSRKQNLKLNVDPLIEKVIKERRLSPLDFLSVNENDQEKDILQRSIKSRLLSLRAFFDSEDNRTALFNIIEIIKRTKRLDIKDPQKSEAVIKKILEITQPGAIRDFLLNFISLYGSLASLPTFKQRLGLFEFAHLYQLPVQAQKEVSDRIVSTYLTSLERTRPISLINITNSSIISQIEYLYLTKNKNQIDEEYIQHLLNQLTFKNPELERREGEKWVKIAEELKKDLEENLRSRQKKEVVATIDRMKDILRAGRGEHEHLLRDPFKGSSLFRERRFARRDPIQKTLDNLPPMNPLMKQLLLSHLTRPWVNGERVDYWISSPTGMPKENWSPEHQRYAGVRIGFKNQYRVTTLFWNWFLQTFFEDQLCKTEDLLNTFTPGAKQQFILGVVTPNTNPIEFTREVIHSIIREGLLSSLMTELKRRIPDLDVDKHSEAIRKIAKEEEKEIIDRRLSELTNVKEVILLQEQPYFPKIADESKYRFTNVSLYSSPSYLQSLYTANIIASYFKDQYYKDVVVTDATSCIGGDTWAFAEKFGHVNAIELNPLHFDILNNNMQQLELNNISYYNENFLSFIPRIKQSLLNPEKGKGYPKKPQVIFIDAPWGGEDYKTNMKVGLYSNDGEFIEISTLIKIIGDSFEEVDKPYMRSPPVLLAIKVPATYDLSKLSHKWFPSKEVFDFKTGSGHILYKLVILDNYSGGRTFQVVNPKTKQHITNINKEAPTFNRIGYKYMKYKEVEPVPISIKSKPSMRVLTREDILKECDWLATNKNETRILNMLNVPIRQEGKIGNKTIAEHCKEAVYGMVETHLMQFYTKHKEVLRYDQLSIRVKEFIGIAIQRSTTVGDFFSRILRVLFVLENPYATAIQQTFLKSSPKWWSYLFGYDLNMLFPEMLAYPSEVQQHIRQLFEQYIYTSSYNFSIYLYNQAYKYPKEDLKIDDKKRYDLYSELVQILDKEKQFYKPVCDTESDLYYIKDGKVECLPLLSLVDHDTELKIPEAIMRDIKSRLQETVGGMTVDQISSAKDAETRQVGINQFEEILNSVNKRNEIAEEISNKYPSIYYEEKEPVYHPITAAIVDWIVINKEEKRKKSIASNLYIIAKAHASSLVRNLVDYFAEQHKDLLTSIILSSKRKGRKLLLETLDQLGFWNLFNDLFKLEEEVEKIYKEQALEDFVYYITGDTIGHVLQEVVKSDPALLKTKCMECRSHLEDQGISSVIMNNGIPLPVSFCSTMCAERFTASYPDQEEMEDTVREQQRQEEEEHKKQIATTLLTGYPSEGRMQDGIFIPSIRNLVIIGDMLRRWVLKVNPELKTSDLEEIYWAIVTSDYYKDVVKEVQSSLFETQKQLIESLSSRLPGCDHISKTDAENRMSSLININWNKIKALLDKDGDKKEQLNFLEDIVKPFLEQTGCTGSNENDVRDIQLISLIQEVGNKIDRALLLGDKSNIVNYLTQIYGLEYEDMIFRRKPYLGKQELIRDVKTMIGEHPPSKDILKITNFLSNISNNQNETKSLQLLIKLLIGGEKQENDSVDFSTLNLVNFRQFLELSNWVYEGQGDNENGIYKLFKFIQKYKGLIFEFTSKLKEYLSQNGWTVQQKLVFKGKEPLEITRDFLSRVAQYAYTQSGSGGSALRKMIIKLQLGGILDEISFRYNQSLTLYKELATIFIKVCSSEIQKENVRKFDLEQMLSMISKSEKDNKKKTKRVTYTEEQCKQWIQDPTIHPITGKDLQTSLEMGYSIEALQKQCEKYKSVSVAPVLGVGRKARVFAKPTAKPQVEQPVDMFKPPKEDQEEEKEFEKQEIDLESLDELLQVLKSIIDKQLSSYLETNPGFFLPRRPLSTAIVVKYNLVNIKVEDRSEERLSSVILKWDHDRNVEFTVSSTGMTVNEINEPTIYLPIGVKANIEYTYLRKDGTPVRPIWLGVDEISLYNIQRGGSGDVVKIPQLRDQEGEEGELVEDVESIDQEYDLGIEPEAEYYPEDNEGGGEEQEQDYGGGDQFQEEEEGF